MSEGATAIGAAATGGAGTGEGDGTASDPASSTTGAGQKTETGDEKSGAGKESSGTKEGAEGAGGEGSGGAGKDKSEPVVPEKYSFSAPEGVALDPEVTADLEGFARSHKLTQESAQAIADLGVKLVQKIQSQQQESQAALQASWKEAQLKDPEFGGDGYKENMALVIEGARAVFTKDELQFLDKSGLGDHPGLVRAMYRLGKFIAQDGPPKKGINANTGEGNEPVKTLEDLAAKLYGKAPKK